MVGRVAWLDDAPGATRPDAHEGDEHPMRKVTKQVAFDGGWDEERRRKVAELFDSMAADWTARLATAVLEVSRGALPTTVQGASNNGLAPDCHRSSSTGIIFINLAPTNHIAARLRQQFSHRLPQKFSHSGAFH